MDLKADNRCSNLQQRKCLKIQRYRNKSWSPNVFAEKISLCMTHQNAKNNVKKLEMWKVFNSQFCFMIMFFRTFRTLLIVALSLDDATMQKCVKIVYVLRKARKVFYCLYVLRMQIKVWKKYACEKNTKKLSYLTVFVKVS